MPPPIEEHRFVKLNLIAQFFAVTRQSATILISGLRQLKVAVTKSTGTTVGCTAD